MSSKKEQLQKVLDDYNTRKAQRIELIWSDGRRSGIGNPQAINVVMEALKTELRRQMDELDF
jgi:hypothetical protein